MRGVRPPEVVACLECGWPTDRRRSVICYWCCELDAVRVGAVAWEPSDFDLRAAFADFAGATR